MDTLRVKELILDHVDPGMRPGIPGTQPARELQSVDFRRLSGSAGPKWRVFFLRIRIDFVA